MKPTGAPPYAPRKSAGRPSRSVRGAVCIGLLAAAVGLIGPLGKILASELSGLEGRRHLQAGAYGLAVAKLQDAARMNPAAPGVHLLLGRAWWEMAGRQTETGAAIDRLRRSREAYRQARRQCPRQSEAAYGIARAAAAAASLSGTPDDETVRAMFREALDLRPHGIAYRYAWAQYLHEQGDEPGLRDQVMALCRIYPSAYGHLKREPFWRDELREPARRGLEAAAAGGITPRSAHQALARMAVDRGDWESVIRHMDAVVAIRTFAAAAGDYIQLGRGCLETGDVARAQEAFDRALTVSRRPERDLEGIYRVYVQAGRPAAFSDISRRARRDYGLHHRADILEARAFLDTRDYGQAKSTLESANRRRETAEAHTWLARVGAAEQDWDAVEIHTQRATVLEPENCRHYTDFARALRKMRKYEQAKEVEEKAKRCRGER